MTMLLFSEMGTYNNALPKIFCEGSSLYGFNGVAGWMQRHDYSLHSVI